MRENKWFSSTNVQTTSNAPYPIPNCEVKRGWGDLVLWWVTTWETSTDVCIFFCFFFIKIDAKCLCSISVKCSFFLFVVVFVPYSSALFIILILSMVYCLWSDGNGSFSNKIGITVVKSAFEMKKIEKVDITHGDNFAPGSRSENVFGTVKKWWI